MTFTYVFLACNTYNFLLLTDGCVKDTILIRMVKLMYRQGLTNSWTDDFEH
jgi:hypothetical protein